MSQHLLLEKNWKAFPGSEGICRPTNHFNSLAVCAHQNITLPSPTAWIRDLPQHLGHALFQPLENYAETVHLFVSVFSVVKQRHLPVLPESKSNVSASWVKWVCALFYGSCWHRLSCFSWLSCNLCSREVLTCAYLNSQPYEHISGFFSPSNFEKQLLATCFALIRLTTEVTLSTKSALFEELNQDWVFKISRLAFPFDEHIGKEFWGGFWNRHGGAHQ